MPKASETIITRDKAGGGKSAPKGGARKGGAGKAAAPKSAPGKRAANRSATKRAAPKTGRARKDEAIGDNIARTSTSKATGKPRHQTRTKVTQSYELRSSEDKPKKKKLKNKVYEKELARLQIELVKLQEWIKDEGLRVCVLFEGRDAAGKGGAIKRITEPLNPRVARVAALAKPTERELGQWYFQRYVAELPTAGEMVLFDRSWYNRAGVERVMGFCTEDEYREFLRTAPEFERMLVREGIILIKYWFSVSDDEQERRFQGRATDPTKLWKLSPMDLESRNRWIEYSKAKDEMFAHTDIKEAPWWVVDAEVKKKARLNCISHLLSMIPYKDVTPKKVKLPKRAKPDNKYVRPPMSSQTFVPQIY